VLPIRDAHSRSDCNRLISPLFSCRHPTTTRYEDIQSLAVQPCCECRTQATVSTRSPAQFFSKYLAFNEIHFLARPLHRSGSRIVFPIAFSSKGVVMNSMKPIRMFSLALLATATSAALAAQGNLGVGVNAGVGAGPGGAQIGVGAGVQAGGNIGASSSPQGNSGANAMTGAGANENAATESSRRNHSSYSGGAKARTGAKVNANGQGG
jgi:hypothetical protein